jgi:hypothetical protein
MNDWDPLGWIEAGAPPEEYDYVTGPLMRKLEERSGEAAVASYVASAFEEHYGARPGETIDFAVLVVAWYETKWRGTTAA